MNRTSKIIGGIALLAFGVVWALELLNIINISLDGWWALFIIVPCFVNIFNDKHKAGSIIGFGIGILLLLAARNVILWADIWKYMICLVAVVWGIALLFFSKKGCCCHCHAASSAKAVAVDGGNMHKIDVSFSKQEYSYEGQRFEGAEVHNSFGFTSLDLRNADVIDGAVITLDCSFGGIEIRVDKGICVKNDIETAFAGVECNCNTQQADDLKTLYVKGRCSFGCIEIK
ncbi:MAG: cell wall-active antibiotics response protein [Bacteroidales bacterium]|nr:cell wall-active antibiotics response protein [Bacteroidales bacterium]